MAIDPLDPQANARFGLDLLIGARQNILARGRQTGFCMLNCRPDQTPPRILGEKLTADPSRVVLRPFTPAWHPSASGPSRSAQPAGDLVQLGEDQAEDDVGPLRKAGRASGGE